MKKITVFDAIMVCLLLILCVVTLYPFYYALIISVSDGLRVQQHNVVLLPQGFTLQNYHAIFLDDRILDATFISLARTVLGTALSLIVIGLCAYSMSKTYFKFKKPLFIFFVIPMYVSGGMLPTFILIHDLHLMNNFLVYILPGCYSTFFMFLMKVFLETIPDNLEESARIDGARELKIMTSVILPLCYPVIATIALFVGVGQWNSWFDALMYVSNQSLHPLQMVLQAILTESQNTADKLLLMGMNSQKVTLTTQTYTMAVLIVTTVPIVFVYPFAQRYFVKGMTLGAVKM
ncbi:carbohydrate ABC transporter permease [Paenibacillus sp. PAMC21692]|uniref:carbohydrate ABC transporter permease n=1 Tax=Paenibacillus sp. PAMC21692 TaxID=2762320 RepID=UPI00164DE28C|nr:carbohydrate ABC transporter permease [Paenibacillus sp. PAMC21692]QNK59366.1 carbohydrate ABC transporter permease [Paenibacillus sp. PAMC21692]